MYPKIRLWRRELHTGKLHWGFGLITGEHTWVHYSFAYHPWYVSLKKTLSHYLHCFRCRYK